MRALLSLHAPLTGTSKQTAPREYVLHELLYPWFLGIPWSRNVQHMDSVPRNEMIQLPGRPPGAGCHGQMEQRFLQALGELGGAFRPADDPVAGGDDERSIRITNVPTRAHDVGWTAGFFESIAAWNDAVFGSTPFRTPTTVSNALGNGPIQCRAIHTGLAAGDDFEWRLAHGLHIGAKTVIRDA